MDTYRVVGPLSYVFEWVGAGPCPCCDDENDNGPPLPCAGHSNCVPLSEIVQANSEAEAADEAIAAYGLRKQADDWSFEAYSCNFEVVNLSQIERDRQALSDWTAGRPIPGGEPVQFGVKW